MFGTLFLGTPASCATVCCNSGVTCTPCTSGGATIYCDAAATGSKYTFYSTAACSGGTLSAANC